MPKRTEEQQWYKDVIIYQAHVRSFMDSNGDGIGDFKGLISKLDYLRSLGVNALWILPFYKSPLRTGGTIFPILPKSMKTMAPWPISGGLYVKHTSVT